MLPKDKTVMILGRFCQRHKPSMLQQRSLSSYVVRSHRLRQDKQQQQQQQLEDRHRLPYSVLLVQSYNQVRFKGHAHWQNVAGTKKAEDQKTSVINSALKIKVVVACREGGSTDPKLNKGLEKVLKECAAADVPKATIQSWLKSCDTSEQRDPVYAELQGPRGVVFILRLTQTSHTIVEDLNKQAKRVKVKLLKHANWAKVFEQKGEIVVPVTQDIDVNDMDKYIEIAIEAGAEDVIVTENDVQTLDVDRVLKFHCDPLKVESVAKEIEETFDLTVYSRDVDLIPHSFATLESEEDVKHCDIVIEKMLALDIVEKVFNNIAPPED